MTAALIEEAFIAGLSNPVVTRFAGNKTSYSTSLPPATRGGAVCTMWVQSWAAESKALGITISGMCSSTRLHESISVLNSLFNPAAEFSFRTAAFNRGLTASDRDSSCEMTCCATWPLAPVTNTIESSVKSSMLAEMCWFLVARAKGRLDNSIPVHTSQLLYALSPSTEPLSKSM